MTKARSINNQSRKQSEDIDRISLQFLLTEHSQHMGNFWANEVEGQSRVNIFLNYSIKFFVHWLFQMVDPSNNECQ